MKIGFRVINFSFFFKRFKYKARRFMIKYTQTCKQVYLQLLKLN